MTSAKPKSSAQKVRDHRERMRRKGMRLVQFWVPDVTTEEFKAEARRQSLAVANSPHEKDDQAFIDSVSVKWWEDQE
jgi:hypothetical protein